jgi:P-type Mg2+ transporter
MNYGPSHSTALWPGSAHRLQVYSEATRRLALHGPNDPAASRRTPPWVVSRDTTPPWLQFLARFRNPLVVILLVASALSAAAGDATSFLIVVTIIALSTTLDFLQESRAHNAVDALRRSVVVRATVRRDSTTTFVPVDQLVPGDIVDLIAGGI